MSKTTWLLATFYLCYVHAFYIIEGPCIPSTAAASLEVIIDKSICAFLPYNPTIIELGLSSQKICAILQGKYSQATFLSYLADEVPSIPAHFLCIHVDRPLYPYLRTIPSQLRMASILSCKIPPSSPFFQVRLYLRALGFHLLTHYFDENEEEEAIFIKEEIYRAIFE